MTTPKTPVIGHVTPLAIAGTAAERAQALSRAMRAARERSAVVARATLKASREMYERVYGKPGERRRDNR